MPSDFIDSMPAFITEIDEKTISRIIEMREIEKASFMTIANELCMTKAKAKHTYDRFYHEKSLELIDDLLKDTKDYNEKTVMFNSFYKKYKTSKKRYDALLKNNQ